MLFLVKRTSRSWSIDWETDLPVPPCLGAVLLWHDKFGDRAYYTLEVPDLTALLDLQAAEGRFILDETDEYDLNEAAASGVTLPALSLEFYDGYRE